MASVSKSKTKFKFKFKDFFPNLLICLGITVFFAPLWVSSQSLFPYNHSHPLTLAVKKAEEYPVSISITPFIKNLTLIAGNFHKRGWDLSPNNALYLSSAGVLGQNGNVVIYGHDTWPVFANLYRSKKGDYIIIRSNLSRTYYYRIDSIKTVNPDDVSILKQGQKDQIITLFTCSGLYDSQRLVIEGIRV